ncbi:histidine phosphatase family protein [Rhodococcus sp. IEGM 1366]|uniref:histidine phosphatase family protein n=1 Tax=Rhodococcus sp. IEGM 1366 TaxID=3082223 RepID=UPI003989AC48
MIVIWRNCCFPRKKVLVSLVPPSFTNAVVAVALFASGGSFGTGSSEAVNAREPIAITFMRHAESAGNVSGVIDTSVPGPELTEKGRNQAQVAADTFSKLDYDGVYASTMIRTQQTADPMAKAVDATVEVLPGLQEIEAGEFDGKPEEEGRVAYAATSDWLKGNRDARIPGGIDGDEFDQRFDSAVEKIYASGDTHPIVFSHGASIPTWVLMNVRNPDLTLVTTDRLPNTGYIVITGTPETGWTLTDWNGKNISQ